MTSGLEDEVTSGTGLTLKRDGRHAGSDTSLLINKSHKVQTLASNVNVHLSANCVTRP